MNRLVDAIKNLQDAMNEEGINPTQGLTEPLFLFASSLIPCTNVDLFIINKRRQLLLAWRDDVYCGRGWHIPGGCLRIRETLDSRIQNTAIKEIGSRISYDSVPLAIREFIVSDSRPKIDNQLVRSHNISFLYKCWLPDDYKIDNRELKENEVGYLKWFDTIPDNLLNCHRELYGDIMIKWNRGELECEK